MRRTVLVVEDNDINRELLCKILQEDYNTIPAVNGLEAIEILKENSAKLSAVILDLVMPELDGYGVLEQMKKNPEWSQIPVIVATGTDDREAERKALNAGAIEYVLKPYDADILRNRLKNTINLREQAAIVNATRIDALTGLMSRAAFFEKVKELVQSHEPSYYIMACFDIDRFKIINDQYGMKKGDEVLKGIANVFFDGFAKSGAIMSRIMADHFAILYPQSFVDTKDIKEIRRKASVLDGSILPVTFSIGRYLVEDCALEPSAMYDRAVLAKESIKGLYDQHVAYYEESMREKIVNEQAVISEMNQALQGHQFEVWYQPQFNHFTGALIGAEALVRWRHPIKGLIPPGMFIPIFERNGFVYEVDKYVWEEACKFLKEMKDSGKEIIPVSVNISRYDLFREDLVAFLVELTHKYKIPIESLRLEITESAFAKSANQIIQVVKELKKHGFTIEIDDFGSGYSSLNTLKDVPADVLKLDMRFLSGKENSERGGNILESVVRMARWLGLSAIAEGVEELEQADYLKSIGCYYIQGYFYSKPLPKEDYKKLMAERGYAEKIMTLEAVANYDSDAFWNPESMESLIFNTYVGGACIFEYQEGKIDILRVNDKYARVINGNDNKNIEPMQLNWEKYITQESKEKSILAMKEAIETRNEVMDEMEIVGFRENGRSVFLRAIMRVIAHTGNRYLFYCVLEDTTAQREAERSQKAIASQLHIVLDSMSSGFSVCCYYEGMPTDMVFANDRFYVQRGYTRKQYEAEVKSVINLVHPDDIPLLQQAKKNFESKNESFEVVYRIIKRDGTIAWLRNKTSFLRVEEYMFPLQIAVTDDVTKDYESCN